MDKVRTLLVCATGKLDEYAGQAFDDILEVNGIPTTETIRTWGLRVKEVMSGLGKNVKVEVDAHPAFISIVENLAIAMREQGATVEVVLHLPPLPPVTDEIKKFLLGQK